MEHLQVVILQNFHSILRTTRAVDHLSIHESGTTSFMNLAGPIKVDQHEVLSFVLYIASHKEVGIS
ncbi:hypothetical protein SCLCIDRAFT_1155578 [Scleroderma citrinum Foug A]|uniref:Uncharacterized protein n=1 Tax=Scleroderma citrinum Foug A TaxID=1036808 RepID=A0A0C3DCH2_9AGAM|nr:hypothetical protein SCLCIDRAFT_1155578 [Scleroderma citrinum Foug A]